MISRQHIQIMASTSSGKKPTNVKAIRVARPTTAAHLLHARGRSPLATAILLREVAHVVPLATGNTVDPVVAVGAVAVALLAFGVDPVGAHALVGVDLLRVHARARLVDVVEVADAAVDLVVGHPNSLGVLGPAEDGVGGRDGGEGGGEEGCEVYF